MNGLNLRRTLAVLGLATVTGLGVAAEPSLSSRPLAFCVAEDNAPFSSGASGGTGVDFELATALAQSLATTARLVWVVIPNRGGIGRALAGSVAAGQCDAFLGIPEGDEVREDLAEKNLVASAPYLTTGYVALQAPGRQIQGLAGLRGASRVGVVTATPADLFLFEQGIRRVPYGGNDALVQALGRGEVEAALVWSPALARARAAGLSLWPGARVAGTPAVGMLPTRFVMALRKGDKALLDAMNATLASLAETGWLADLAARHGLDGGM